MDERPTLKELFAQVEAEPVRCTCGKELIFSKKDGRFGLDECPCGQPSPEGLPDSILIGPEGGPLWIYPRKGA